MRPTILLVLLAVLVRGALAQAHPDVTEILKKVGETYRAAKEYELISTSTGTAVPGRLLLAFRAPNRFRTEGADPNLDNADGTFDEIVLVCDGSSVWLYHPKANEYAAFTSDLTGDLRPEAMDDFAIGRFKGAADLSRRATFLREEALEMNGTRVDCYVVTVPVSVPREGTSIHTWWVEKKSNRIVREDHGGSSVVFTTIKLNEPLPDDLFKFVPPPGARRTVGN
jgi:outer membrane lipoprotein-sorting protein